MTDARIFRNYIRELQANTSRGDATEHTHRPALKTLLEAAQPGIIATNEPRRIACGAPDYSISAEGFTVGYIEAKDVGVSLDAVERDEQLERYLANLPNLILTNYTEFRWYVDGDRRLSATLATKNRSGNLTANREGISDTCELREYDSIACWDMMNTIRPRHLGK